MKKFKYVFAAALMLLSVSAAAACNKGEDGESVLLNYGTGLGGSSNYNSELYAYNQIDASGADVSTVYVPADRIHKDGEPAGDKYSGYYIYNTGGTRIVNNIPEEYPDDVVAFETPCLYSKDLSVWTKGGVGPRGYALYGRESDWEDWAEDDGADVPWAPEVIWNEEEKLYYMYYNTTAKDREYGDIATGSTRAYDRLYIGIATSEYPCGPFYTISDTDEVTGENVPFINFRKAYGLDYDYAVIDVHPFVEDDGQMYLYFTKEPVTYGAPASQKPRGSMVMKMKEGSWTEPDYTTLQYVLLPGYKTVESLQGAALANAPQVGENGYRYGVKGVGDIDTSEGGINEGPFVLKHNGKYYITYSGQGFKHASYTVFQAVGDSPMGPFEKFGVNEGNPLLSGAGVAYVKGTGHHSFVKVENELFIVYHVHANTISHDSGWNRYIYTDRVHFVENQNGDTVLTANGPSEFLQWLPESASGYKNLATEAEITLSKGAEGKEYLTDEILPFYNFNSDWFMTTDDDVTVTLTFDTAVSVRSVMIYNAYETDQAFSKIAKVQFELAETPSWATKDYKYAVIENLEFPSAYVDYTDETIINCAPAVAEFDEMKVRSISITIKKEDRVVAFNKFGEANTALALSEIVVLGR